MLINLTQHTLASINQPLSNITVKGLLTFSTCPSTTDLEQRAEHIAVIAEFAGATHAVIGGAPYFMPYLERALIERGIRPMYAFSERVAVETVNDDGSVSKTSVFRHGGWIEVK